MLLKDSHNAEEYYWYEYLSDKDVVYLWHSAYGTRNNFDFTERLDEIYKTIRESLCTNR